MLLLWIKGIIQLTFPILYKIIRNIVFTYRNIYLFIHIYIYKHTQTPPSPPLHTHRPCSSVYRQTQFNGVHATKGYETRKVSLIGKEGQWSNVIDAYTSYCQGIKACSATQANVFADSSPLIGCTLESLHMFLLTMLFLHETIAFAVIARISTVHINELY